MPPTRPEHLRCPGCRLQRWLCMCDLVPRLDNRLPVLVVRHWKEAGRSTNTAHLAARALARCTVLDHGLRGRPVPRESVAVPGAWLLFPPDPPPGATQLELPPAPPPPEPPALLVVLDGTWGQARRMARQVPGVPELPRFVLPPRPGRRPRARRPPAPWAMATLEAIARALDHYGEHDVAAALDALFDEFVRRVHAQAGRPPA